MIEKIQQLLAIQEKDIAIIQLEDKKILLPRSQQEVRQRVESKQKELEAAKILVRESQLIQKKIEIEVESKKTICQKYEGQLNTVKTNQEYKALEKEIFTCKTDISRMEDGILEKLMLVDQQNAIVKRLDTQLQEEKTRQAASELEIGAQIKEVEEALAHLRRDREGLVKRSDDHFYRRYTKILNHVKGQAVVPIIDRSCQGCHTKLTPQIVIDVTRSSELVSCDNCARILFIPDDSSLTKVSDSNPTPSSSERI